MFHLHATFQTWTESLGLYLSHKRLFCLNQLDPGSFLEGNVYCPYLKQKQTNCDFFLLLKLNYYI